MTDVGKKEGRRSRRSGDEQGRLNGCAGRAFVVQRVTVPSPAIVAPHNHSVPREECTCRLCEQDVETLEHALLVCEGSESLVRERARFLEWVQRSGVMLRAGQPVVERLKELIRSEAIIRRMALPAHSARNI